VTPLTVIVPMLPPSVNHMYLANRKGGKRLSDEALTFRALVDKEIRDITVDTGCRLPDGPLEFRVYLTFENRRNADIDNRLKAAVDAVALALGFNDARIDRIVAERAGVEKGKPLCEMVLLPKVR
jgi:Holliday junction resolvase RusA-like endonuclease